MLGRMLFLVRFVLLGALTSLLGACGGGGNNGGFFNGGQCNPGTAVQLANPFPSSVGVASNTNPIIIVTNGNANNLSNSYQSWDIVLQDNFGDQFVGSPFSLVADSSGPHPFASDFYYASSLPQSLIPNTAYRVFVNQFNSNCNLVQVGSFST